MSENFQYQLDLAKLAGNPEAEAVAHSDSRGHLLGIHVETLFDQDESNLGGDRINSATGRKYDNSTFVGIEDLRIIDSTAYDSDWHDVLAPLDDEDDAAARWLRNEGYDARMQAAEADEARILGIINNEEVVADESDSLTAA